MLRAAQHLVEIKHPQPVERVFINHLFLDGYFANGWREVRSTVVWKDATILT